MHISIVINDDQAVRALIQTEGAVTDLTPVIHAIAGEIDDRVQGAFEAKADPVTGILWPELRRATVRERERRGFNPNDILQRTRILRGGVIAEPDARGVTVHAGSVEYAPAHQFGNEARNIPMRRFAGVSPQDVDHFTDLLRRHIEGSG